MKSFLLLALFVIGYGYLLTGGPSEEPVPSLREKLAVVGVTVKKGGVTPVIPTKPTTTPAIPSGSLEKEVVEAAKLLKPYTKIPVHLLVAMSEQESTFRRNCGEIGRAIPRGVSIEEIEEYDLSIEDQYTLKTQAWVRGYKDPNMLRLSKKQAGGFMQTLPRYYRIHCGIRIEFGATPTVLLHGTAQYRSMTQAERIAGVREIQHKLGLVPEHLDGLIGPKTLDAIEKSVGRRNFDKVGKYLLVEKFYGEQVKMFVSKKRDKVFQRICLAEGKNPAKTKYFLPDVWKPLHALACATIHMEDDLRIANRSFRKKSKAIEIVVAAYYCGIKSAINHNRGGLWYKNQIKAKAKKFRKPLA